MKKARGKTENPQVPLSLGLGSIIKTWLPIIGAIAAATVFYINFINDAPVFREPKYKFITRETFMEYAKDDMIQYLPGIYECITNESNEWLSHSLIEVVEVTISSGIAIETCVYFDVYTSSGMEENGHCLLLTLVPESPTTHEIINLKTFDDGRTIMFPISITAPLYDVKSGEKNFDSDELNRMEKVIIQFLPKYIECRNGKWQRIPILGQKTFKTRFDGMKYSNPIP